jgi:hypothetical protein
MFTSGPSGNRSLWSLDVKYVDHCPMKLICTCTSIVESPCIGYVFDNARKLGEFFLSEVLILEYSVKSEAIILSAIAALK